MPFSTVARAVEDLYVACADQQKPRRIEACPCCVDHDEICTLLNTPLRELKPEQLGGYASSVFLTAGSESDFIYFLPRIVEISATDCHWYPDVEIVLGKLALASWERWPQRRRDALMRVFHAAFDAAIQAEDTGSAVDAWVCGLAIAGIDTAPFLQKLLDPRASDALVAYYDWNAHALFKKRRPVNAFWKDHPDKMQPVLAWFRSDIVQAAVEERRRK